MSSPPGISCLSDGRVLVCTSPVEQILLSFPYSADAKFLKNILILFSKTWLELQLHNTKQFRVSIVSALQLGFLCKTLVKASQKLLIPAAHVNLACSLFSSFICSTETVLYPGLLKFFSSLSSRIHQPFPSLLSSMWDLAKELRGWWSTLLYWFSLEWSTKSFYSLCTSLALQSTREKLPHRNVSAPYVYLAIQFWASQVIFFSSFSLFEVQTNNH